MLPNVLSKCLGLLSHAFYYLCILPFQLISILVILILEFHICPHLDSKCVSFNKCAIFHNDPCFLNISLQIYRKHFSALIIMCAVILFM